MDPLLIAGPAIQGLTSVAMAFSENEWRNRELRENKRQFNESLGENKRQHNENLGENKRQFDGTMKFNYDRFYEDKYQFRESHQLNKRMAALEENKFSASESQRRIENAGFLNMIGRA